MAQNILFNVVLVLQADFYQNIGFPIRDRMVPDMPSKVGDIPVIGHYREAK